MDEKRHLWGVDSTMTGYTHIRKAHCMFGWDWGPMLPDMGIWRSVSLIVPDAGRILDVYYSQKHTDNKVTLKALLHIENHGCKKAMVEISDPQGNIAAKADISLEKSAEYYETELVINDPQLWWVNGYGEQPLYSCAVTLYDENGSCADKNTQRIGLRTLTVSREKDQWGEEFCFINNGVKIFAMGANYIPEDQIVTRCNEVKTRKLLADCKAANYNFIRVWGGGYYPDEYFYDYCDENGIIVWQDFMFACSAYLLTEEFEETVRGEVRDNVIRLRNHPSLGMLSFLRILSHRCLKPMTHAKTPSIGRHHLHQGEASRTLPQTMQGICTIGTFGTTSSLSKRSENFITASAQNTALKACLI